MTVHLLSPFFSFTSPLISPLSFCNEGSFALPLSLLHFPSHFSLIFLQWGFICSPPFSPSLPLSFLPYLCATRVHLLSPFLSFTSPLISPISFSHPFISRTFSSFSLVLIQQGGLASILWLKEVKIIFSIAKIINNGQDLLWVIWKYHRGSVFNHTVYYDNKTTKAVHKHVWREAKYLSISVK